MSKNKVGSQPTINFSESELQRISKRFNEHANSEGLFNRESFKKSMGLMGIGECELLCDRIFPLITKSESFNFEQFVQFLNLITYSSKSHKAKLSFDFLDRHQKGYITCEDIEIVISEISFIWNFLTGEKISNEESIQLVCEILGVNEHKSITFSQYLQVYDHDIDWFDYFNNQIQVQTQVKRQFNISQVEEYLRVLKDEVEAIIQRKCTIEAQQEFSGFSHGPNHISGQQFKPKGDPDTRQDTLSYQVVSTLPSQGSQNLRTYLQTTVNKLSQLCSASNQILPEYKPVEQRNRLSSARGRKKIMTNVTIPERRRQNMVYFGHQNWNLMLSMMLGIRKALKSNLIIFESQVHFSQEDLNCKYEHELIYKYNNKSIKQVCELFIDYAPKVFFYIRKWFSIAPQEYLKSIGLEYLIGNILMGNLSTLTDQTSQGKSGSFIYYTEDSKLIVKSISREQYKKLRSILGRYVEYLQTHPNTLLMRIYGLYKLKNQGTNRQIYFIVVNNFFANASYHRISQRYDIKGSTHNRQTNNKANQNTALKDLDLINKQKRAFNMNPKTKHRVYKQIVSDSEFLAENNIIEYSLLIGILNDTDQADCVQADNCNEFASTDSKQKFFFGIIDILTDYSAIKVVENHLLHLFNSDISCLAPMDYHERFKNFIYKYVFGP